MPGVLLQRLFPLARARRAWPWALALAALLLSGSAVWDYLRVRDLSYHMVEEQARALVAHVESSAERATRSEEAVRQALADHLHAVAALLEEPSGRIRDAAEWRVWATRSSVDRVDLFDPSGAWLAGTGFPSGPREPARFQPPGLSHDGRWTLGPFSDTQGGSVWFGVARRLGNGRLLRVAVPVLRLREIRRSVGMGALLRDLASHPDLLYAVLDSPDQLLAATPNLPEWVEQPGDPVHEQALRVTGFETVRLKTPGGSLFEARTPFGPQPGVVLRLGLTSPGLQSILARARMAIAVRTLLGMALAALLLATLLSRRSLRVLGEEKTRIQDQVERLQAERAQDERMAAMGALAGGVAHEIRNPLNTITMAAQRLEFQLDPVRHAAQFQEVVKAIRGEAQRIERIVTGFLQLAKPAAVQRRPEQPAEVLRPVVETFAAAAAARNTEFRVELDGLPILELDADAFRQAVLNLLRNALQAAPTAGGRISLRGERHGTSVHLAVADNGPGVPPEDRQRIFDLYYTTRAEGSGLGLPLVRRFARQHGGRVEVGETPGGGATFTLFLEVPA
jgi:two-component system sensor histidine kinase HydH